MADRLLTGKEVAYLLNISKALAYRLMARGTIPALHLGRAVRVRPQDLDKFVEKSVSASENLGPSMGNPIKAWNTHRPV